MTTAARDGKDTPFGRWIRNHHGLDSVRECLSVQNSDLWVHRYSKRKERNRVLISQVIDHLMDVEVKCFDADQPFAQRDTLSVVDDLLRLCSTKRSARVGIKIRDRRMPGRIRTVRWLGYHVLQLSGDAPDNSERILWDGKDITEEQLVEILRFDRDPDHPTKLLDTRRHHKRPMRETREDFFARTGGVAE